MKIIINNACSRDFKFYVDNKLIHPDSVEKNKITYLIENKSGKKHRVVIIEDNYKNSRWWWLRLLNPISFIRNSAFRESIRYKNQDFDEDVCIAFDFEYNANDKDIILEYQSRIKDGFLVNSLEIEKSDALSNISYAKSMRYYFERTVERIIPRIIVSVLLWVTVAFMNDRSAELCFVSVGYSVLTIISIAMEINKIHKQKNNGSH